MLTLDLIDKDIHTNDISRCTISDTLCKLLDPFVSLTKGSASISYSYNIIHVGSKNTLICDVLKRILNYERLEDTILTSMA